MTPSESEFEALRARVSRLEAVVAALSKSEPDAGDAPKATAPVSVETEIPVPPVLPPVRAETAFRSPAPEPVGGNLPATRREITSAVWIAGVGAVIFLVGAIYGLTVSIQRGWISPPVRVGAGLGIGLALGYGALRQFSREHRGLAVALLAAGVGTWMFSWHVGAHRANLFPLSAGLLGTSVATLAAGWLAARMRSDGAMAVALATGLATPLAFSTGQGTAGALLGYLLVLSLSHVAVLYVVQTGAMWGWSRMLGQLGVWLIALVGVGGGRLENLPAIFGLLVLLAGGGLIRAWLPKHAELPRWPGAGTVVNLIGLAAAAWLVWTRSRWEREEFSSVLIALAMVSLVLARLARRRDVEGGHDFPLLLLAVGFSLVALAVALEPRWLVVAWGVGAVLLGLGARVAADRQRVEMETLQRLTVVAATASTMVWFALAFDQRRGEMIFINRVFFGATLSAVAWALVASRAGRWRALAVVVFQFVGINALAWELSRALPMMHSENATLALGPLLATLTYAVAGAALWLRGLADGHASQQKLLRVTGYVWLAVAAAKLLLSDLARADLLFRAVAALGVGAILIAAAWWASQRRAE